ncbi:chitin deacetylase 1 [Venturia nashicola]|uniref:Chitin deacetylase 1 n=1 Tax=Venturia nashicola TaxID=86259 RepID=A0A4Z1NJV2_9PEZI|nr:chitin deacetylase 1 [Venturia nashicola]
MVHIEESVQIARDFEGFGESSQDCKWPNNARIAVSFVLNYEEGGERSYQDGDGFRVGCWRIARLMKEKGWKMTIYAISKAMERNPKFAKACVREGHEIAAHGLRWLEFWNHGLEEDKKYIKDSFLDLEKTTGEMPVGFYFGRGTPNTHYLVPIVMKEMGLPLLYSSECYNDEVPYWVDLPWENDLPIAEREGMLMIPYNYDCNDGKHLMSQGFTSAAGQSYENYLKSTFDMLYREGGKMMNIPMHSRIVGKAGRAEALRNFMNYIAEKEGVWVTTRRDIAKHYRETFPYQPADEKTV